jgi:cytidylate kinase
LRVGSVAHTEDRIRTIMDREKVDHKTAETMIENRDMAREYYFQNFFGLDDPDRPDLYHLVVNTSEVSLEYGRDLIIDGLHALEEGKITGPIKS